jgi:hypothetical protein
MSSNFAELNRENIESIEQVKVVDEDEDADLQLLCYDKCNDEDSDTLKQCRGLVYNDYNLVMRAFPYTTEYISEEYEKIDAELGHDIKKCHVFESHEGCLLRMFNFNDKWYLSTHRKLNAFQSKWGSKDSFGSLFKRALESVVSKNDELRNSLPNMEKGLLERFQSTLDTNKQYMFLVINNSNNRIVCVAPEDPMVYHVGTFVDGELVMEGNDCGIPTPQRLKFNSTSDLCDHVNNCDIRKIQGLIVFAPNNKQYKIVHEDYRYLFNVRGNEPSIKFRYLNIRMNNELRGALYYLYPEMVETFETYEDMLYTIANDIYKAYVSRFIKKEYVVIPKDEFSVMKLCHSWYLTNPTENRVRLEVVINIMNEQNSVKLNRMIKTRLRQLQTTNNTEFVESTIQTSLLQA